MSEAERPRFMSHACMRSGEQALAAAVSAAIVELDARLYGDHRTTATTYIDDKIVLCVLESMLTAEEDALITGGGPGQAIDGRVAVQADTRGGSTRAVERLTRRRVRAFKSSQAAPGVALELFLLDSAPLTLVGRGQGLPKSIGVE
jgi:hypothetical protein